MTLKPRFTLKAILVIVAALSVPVGMMSSGIVSLIILGTLIVLPVVGGCVGYVVAGWAGAGLGVSIGCSLVLVSGLLLFLFGPVSLPIY
jgi:hypothetical protein